MLYIVLGIIMVFWAWMQAAMGKLQKYKKDARAQWIRVNALLRTRSQYILELLELARSKGLEADVMAEIYEMGGGWCESDDREVVSACAENATPLVDRFLALANGFPELSGDEKFRELAENLAETEEELEMQTEKYNHFIDLYNEHRERPVLRPQIAILGAIPLKGMHIRRKTSTVLLFAVLVIGMLGFTGCTGDSGANGADTTGPGVSAGSEDNTDETVRQTYQLSLYFADEAYITTGDESLEKFKVLKREITSVPEESYRNALEQLKTPSEDGSSTVISDRIKFNDVYLEGNTVYVDLSSNGLSGGSLEETFLIGQIVDTLINSFDEVEQVQFLVDGEKAETLMGHIGAADPFTHDLFTE